MTVHLVFTLCAGLSAISCRPVVLPQPFSTLEQCESQGKIIAAKDGNRYFCIEVK